MRMSTQKMMMGSFECEYVLGGKSSYKKADGAGWSFQPTRYADTMESPLWPCLVSMTNWYNLADDGDDRTLVECRW
jgi:hypothetical protein